MLNFSELNILLEEALSLDEKIMTKKQAARKRRLKAERRKAKQAELEKQKQEPIEPEIVEPEIETEGESTGTALVVYQKLEEKPEQDYNQISEEFKIIWNELNPIIKKHEENVVKAMKMWESAGKDGPCPIEAWNILNTSIQELQKGIQQSITKINIDNLQQPELEILDKFLTMADGYLDKAQKQITAAKPNLEEKDFEAPVPASSNELTTSDQSTEVTTKQNQASKNTSIDRNKRTKKNLVSYDSFKKGFLSTFESYQKLCGFVKPILEAIGQGASAVWKIALHPIDWLGDKAWNILTSPLARDIIKTLAYSNPLTAMIFDGDFGNFGIGDGLNKLHDATKKAIKNTRQGYDPEKFTKKGFPKNINEMNLDELQKALYGNKAFVDCINVSYNHPEVNRDYKALLKKSTTEFTRRIKAKDIDSARKALNQLVETCEDICDSMSWTKSSDWQNLVTKYIKAKGNTEKEEKQINKKANKSQISDQRNQLYNEIRVAAKSAKAIKKDITKQELTKVLMDQGYKENDINRSGVLGESYQEEIKELMTLLEAAEA